ncbi:MAG: hypothetical protein J2P57_19005, partial [Acidimicrobiaceae bacterium]|nr:hypothetical protein [Acidimicrobiaceae bacterium]
HRCLAVVEQSGTCGGAAAGLRGDGCEGPAARSGPAGPVDGAGTSAALPLQIWSMQRDALYGER